MNLQVMLAGVLTNLRKPGFVKSMAGQLAVMYGSQLSMEAASEANERYEEATVALESVKRQLADRGPALRKTAAEMIRAGVLDDEVRDRAAQLAADEACHRARDAQLADDEAGPPETMGAVRDLPGDEPTPPCADPTCVLDYRHDGPHRPAIPPRMSGGGYLSVVADLIPATVPDVPDVEDDGADRDDD